MGRDPTLVVARQHGQEQAGIVLSFTDINLPADAHVQSATLAMMLDIRHTAADRENEVSVYALHRAWSENEAAWIRASARQNWGAPGANSVPDDRAGQAADTVLLAKVLNDPPELYWTPVAWDVTDVVQSQPPQPGQTYRFKVMYGRGNGTVVFGSRESEHPPQLAITYTLIPNETHEKRYYLVNGQPVALREDGALYYLFGDHLGSTSLVVSAATGEVVAEQRYLPFGGVRWRAGALPTDRQYTGQRWDETLGLYDYRARYYDPTLGRFIQPDTVVPEPGDPQALNRYAYVLNNPLRYNDPVSYTHLTLPTKA